MRSFATGDGVLDEYTTKGEEEAKKMKDEEVVRRRKKTRTSGGSNDTSKLAKKSSGPTWEWIPPARKVEEKEATQISGKDRPVSSEPAHYATKEIAAMAAATKVQPTTAEQEVKISQPEKKREFRDAQGIVLQPHEISGFEGETAFDKDGDEYYVNEEFIDEDIDSGDLSADDIPTIEDLHTDLTEEEMEALEHWTADELFGEKIAGIPVVEGVRFTPEEVVDMLERNAARDIVVIDLSEKVAIVNTLVICSARSTQHMRKLAKLTYQGLKARKLELVNPKRPIEGYDLEDWMLIDTGDMVINFFSDKGREFYNVEHYWNVEYDERQAALRAQEDADDAINHKEAGIAVKKNPENEEEDFDFDDDEEWEDDEDDEDYDEDEDEEVDLEGIDTDELLRSMRNMREMEERIAGKPKYWKDQRCSYQS